MARLCTSPPRRRSRFRSRECVARFNLGNMAYAAVFRCGDGPLRPIVSAICFRNDRTFGCDDVFIQQDGRQPSLDDVDALGREPNGRHPSTTGAGGIALHAERLAGDAIDSRVAVDCGGLLPGSDATAVICRPEHPVNADIVQALRNTELFRQLDHSVLSQLAQRAVWRRLRRDEVLFMTGEAAHGLYVIASGSVRAYRTGGDGREQVIHTEQAGATVGEVPLFDDQPYPSTVAAEEDSAVVFIDKASVLQMCHTHP